MNQEEIKRFAWRQTAAGWMVLLGFLTLHEVYFPWEGYRTHLAGWDALWFLLFALGLALFSESSYWIAAQHEHPVLDAVHYSSWGLMGLGAVLSVWTQELTFLSGVFLLSVAVVWGLRMAPWPRVRRILATLAGAGFPWLIWTVDLLPTLMYDNHEFQLQTVPVIVVFSIFTGWVGWSGQAELDPPQKRWEIIAIKATWVGWSLSVLYYSYLFVRIGLWNAALPGILAGFWVIVRTAIPAIGRITIPYDSSIVSAMKFHFVPIAWWAHAFAAGWLIWTTWILSGVTPVMG